MQEASRRAGLQVGELQVEEDQGPAIGKAVVQNMPLIHTTPVIKRRARTEEEVLDQLSGEPDHTEVRRSDTEVKDVV